MGDKVGLLENKDKSLIYVCMRNLYISNQRKVVSEVPQAGNGSEELLPDLNCCHIHMHGHEVLFS